MGKGGEKLPKGQISIAVPRSSTELYIDRYIYSSTAVPTNTILAKRRCVFSVQ